MSRICTYTTLTLALALLPVAAQAPSPGLPPALHPVVFQPGAAPFQVGIGTWYGSYFQGRETTSGQRFNMYAMTAAHKFLPFGTRVRVTNLLNERTVIVRINDRGPVPEGRVIDLSWAAARVLHFYEDGLIPVRLDILPEASGSASLKTSCKSGCRN